MRHAGTDAVLRRIGACVPLLPAVLVFVMGVAYAGHSVTIDRIKSVIPRAASHVYRTGPVDHYRVRDDKGRDTGIAFVTSAIPPAVRGYRDELDVLVGMDMSGVITGVVILAHRDDAAYVERLTTSGFLKRFIGRTIERGFDDIETVTGATVSSDAVKRDIQTAAFEIHAKLIDKGIIGTGARHMPSPFEVLAVAAIVMLMAGAVAAIAMPRRRWIRFVLWPLAVAVIGLWLNTPITIGAFADLRHALFPAYLPLFMLMVFAAIAALVRGNLYCAYLCPFGALQEGAARLNAPKCRPSPAVERNAAWLRWIVLMAAVFGIAAGIGAFRVIEPFSRLFARSIAVGVYIQAAMVLVAALFVRRPWCKYFCPTGAVLDLISRTGNKAKIALKGGNVRADEQAHS